MPISKQNKIISKALQSVFNGIPKYTRYADEIGQSTIDIISCVDRPWKGTTSFGTLGLSDYSIGKKVDGVPLGVEFVGCCESNFDFFPNILATCAFNIINSKFKCEPGTIYPDVIREYANSEMKHVMLTTPFIWEKNLDTLDFSPHKITTWLLIVPISDNEFDLAKKKGTDALAALLEEKDIDILDLLRSSSV